MERRTLGLALGVAAALAAFIVNCACAVPYYAVAAGTSKLYMLSTESTSAWNNLKYQELVTQNGASFSGIAVSENRIYAADAQSNSLYIYDVTHENGVPVSAGQVKKISLAGGGSKQFFGPTEVALDGSGGVYILGTAYVDQSDVPHYTYQYVKPSATEGWDSPTRTIYELPFSPMVDVASFGTGAGAVLLHISSADGEPGYPSMATQLIDGPDTVTTRLDPGNDPGPNQQPVAIAVNPEFGQSGYAYVVNGATADGPGGSLTVLNASSMSKQGDTIILPDQFIPQDITSFTLTVDSVTKHYLAVVGNYPTAGPGTPSVAEVWRIELDGDGRPVMTGIDEVPAGNSLAGLSRYLAASEDGAVTWMTGKSTNSVMVLDNTADIWNQLVGIDIDDVDQSIRRISSYTVPEPSSIVGLLALSSAAAAAGLRRRRH